MLSSFENQLFSSLAHLLAGSFGAWEVNICIPLCVLEMSSLSEIHGQDFCGSHHSSDCLLAVQKAFQFPVIPFAAGLLCRKSMAMAAS